ncbi:hypothetical protein B0T14DRAFT_569030 [Immersiella caudata]|uniref:Uncharacterized protein n=1 Tax=Immersiella caudata TaxID=314043 RepID=A0AA40BXR7_9PEZI|nr:hypothetical protein B0T14DRAFT_569030 [Immersiella caudata]
MNVGFNGPEGISGTWKILAAALTLMSKMESLYLVQNDEFAFEQDQRLSLSRTRQKWRVCEQEYSFWLWMSGVDHIAITYGAIDAPPKSASCCRVLPCLTRVTLGYQGSPDTPPQILASLFARPRSLCRLELNRSRVPITGMPPSASDAARDLQELRLDSGFIHSSDFLRRSVCLKSVVEAFPNLASLEVEIKDPCELKSSLGDNDIEGRADTDAWNPGKAYSELLLRSGHVPPLLTELDKLISLESLTTESVWLFGSHLVKYPYCPSFAVGPPVEFYENTVSRLPGEVLLNLRDITLSAYFRRVSGKQRNELDDDSEESDNEDDGE